MALFQAKNNKEEKKEKSAKDDVLSLSGFNEVSVILRPRVTEKATLKAEGENVYVFEVEKSANKKNIKRAVKERYKVTPVKINITKSPAKNVVIRGKKGVKSGVKKAYVYLKKDEKIEIV